MIRGVHALQRPQDTGQSMLGFDVVWCGIAVRRGAAWHGVVCAVKCDAVRCRAMLQSRVDMLTWEATDRNPAIVSIPLRDPLRRDFARGVTTLEATTESHRVL